MNDIHADSSTNSDAQARRYDRIHNWLFLVDIGVVLFLLALLMWGGDTSLSAQLVRGIKKHISSSPWITTAVYISFLSAAYALIMVPYSWWKSYYLEHYFNLSTQSPLSWTGDYLKSFALSTVIAVFIFEIFYALLRSAGTTWWIWAAGAWILLQVVLGMIFPVIILPLFYHTESLEQPELNERIRAYAQAAGMKVVGIFRLDLSEKTKKANAALAGLGKTKRILLGDTLLNTFTHDEIVTILAHEFGHFFHGHLLKLIGIAAVTAVAGMWIAHHVLFFLSGVMEIEPATIASAPLLILALFVFSIITMPVTNTLSRYFEHQADTYALNATREPETFITAMERLAEQNLAHKEPHPVIEFLLHSHPCIARRIARAREWQDSDTSL